MLIPLARPRPGIRFQYKILYPYGIRPRRQLNFRGRFRFIGPSAIRTDKLAAMPPPGRRV